MDTVIKSIKENYENNLKASEQYSMINDVLSENYFDYEFLIKSLLEISESGRFQGTKLLEIGSGPTVHNIAPFSSKFTHIVQSDYVLDNCNELRRWHAGTSSLDWSKFLNKVLKLEGMEQNEDALKKLENRIRKSVKAVIRCDLHSDHVINTEELTPDTSPPYDLIISVLCLESVAPDYEGYVAYLRKLRNLLRRGGGIVTCGCINQSFWQVGDNNFHHVKLSADQIKSAFSQAGFGNIEFKSKPKKINVYGSVYDNYDGLYSLSAEKL